ncbi:hypothetical protein ABPG74_019115 [Tetrahymena malaccensis]
MDSSQKGTNLEELVTEIIITIFHQIYEFFEGLADNDECHVFILCKQKKYLLRQPFNAQIIIIYCDKANSDGKRCENSRFDMYFPSKIRLLHQNNARMLTFNFSYHRQINQSLKFFQITNANIEELSLVGQQKNAHPTEELQISKTMRYEGQKRIQYIDI